MLFSALTRAKWIPYFEISHDHEGFHHFFARIEAWADRQGGPVAVAMEGYNGHARPLVGLTGVSRQRVTPLRISPP